jgi:TonB family protein
MASVVTTEFVRTIHADAPPFSLIEQQSLLSRLIQALDATVGDFVGDPRGFIRNLLSADAKDAKRRQRIYLGSACALVVHVALIVLIAVIGWRTVYVSSPADQPEYRVTLIEPPRSIEEPTIENAVSSKPEMSKGNGGGGGGGQHAPLPPSQGQPPPMVPGPQMVSMNPSNIPEPTLPFSPTIVGPLSPPPPPAPIGDPTGKSGDFSGGPGDGGGIGRSKGTGVGDGKGPGTGPGGRGGRGGGLAGSPDGSASGIPDVVDFNRVGSWPRYRSWTWIRKERAIVTPEARENKVMGTVVLRANFNADGTITDIEVAMPVEFMNESAIESLRRCTFRPATIDGKPVSVRRVLIRIDVHY